MKTTRAQLQHRRALVEPALKRRARIEKVFVFRGREYKTQCGLFAAAKRHYNARAVGINKHGMFWYDDQHGARTLFCMRFFPEHVVIEPQSVKELAQ